MKEKFNLTDVIPYPDPRIIASREDELVVLAYPRFKSKWARKLFLPKSMSTHVRVRLEAHGTAVWDLIDGQRTIGQIIELLAEHFAGEEDHPHRVSTYIEQLHKDGFVKYRIKT